MRIIRFDGAAKASDVIARVIDRRATDQKAVLARIAALNPHVNIKDLEAGTVLILPDEPGIRRGGKRVEAAGSLGLSGVGDAIKFGLDASDRHAARAIEDSDAERAELQSALKSGAAKRQLESDPGLREQLGAAAAFAKGRQKELKSAADNIDLLRQSFTEEFRAMSALFD